MAPDDAADRLQAALDRFTNSEAVAGLVEGLSLATMRTLTRGLGLPQDGLPAVHVTGTNGKGSVVHMVAALLSTAGLAVGRYTSPHLESPTERVEVGGEPLDPGALLDAVQRVVAVVDVSGVAPSQFEVLTAAALLAFSDHAVDVAVVEVGLLGRYDATNVVDARVAVLTNVGTDHTDLRPGWRRALAVEKAGIVKPGSTFLNGEVDPELAPVLAATPAARTLLRDRDFGARASRVAVGGRVVDLVTPWGRHDDVFVAAHGPHQGENAALAVAAAEAFLDAPLDDGIVAEALGGVRLPGRFEKIGGDPLIVLDGAHNVEAARALARTIDEELMLRGSLILVVGMLRGRDVRAVLDELDAGRAGLVVACSPPSPRAVPAAEVAAAATELGATVETVSDVASAVERARALATADDVIVVTGSLYVIGAARRALRAQVGAAGED